MEIYSCQFFLNHYKTQNCVRLFFSKEEKKNKTFMKFHAGCGLLQEGGESINKLTRGRSCGVFDLVKRLGFDWGMGVG